MKIQGIKTERIEISIDEKELIEAMITLIAVKLGENRSRNSLEEGIYYNEETKKYFWESSFSVYHNSVETEVGAETTKEAFDLYTALKKLSNNELPLLSVASEEVEDETKEEKE
jgi:hypothetical protein